MKRIEIIVLLVFLNALVVFGQQSTYVLTINTPDKIEDTSVEWGQSEIRGVNRQEGNNGQNIYIHAMAWTWDGIPGINRGLIKFDLDQLPANSEIVKAKLSLYHYEIEDKCWPMSNLSGSNEVYLKRVTSDWVEDEVTWNTQPTTTVENQVILPGSSSRTQDYLDIDVTELVNQIVVSGENYGFMLQLATEEYYRCMIFCSSDYENSTMRPKLVIEYKIKESHQAPISNVRKISATQGGFTGKLDARDAFNNLQVIGDIDGDGIEDLAVGSNDDDGAVDAGAVYILFMNKDRTVKNYQKISALEGNFHGSLDSEDFFGRDITPIGDFDGDGVIDIAVGAWGDDDVSGAGAVWILFLNSNGTVKNYQKISATQGGLVGLTANRQFGFSVTSLGDLNGDGITDIAVGSPTYDNDGGLYRGCVWILFLNRDGTVKSQQKINDYQGGFTGILDDEDRLGLCVENIGDINGDRIVDIAVYSARDDDGASNAGAIYILFLNSDGTAKHTQKISALDGNFGGAIAEEDHFGQRIVNIGDIDGNGINDILTSSYGSDDGGLDRGKAWVIYLNSDATVKDYNEINSQTPALSGLLENGDSFGSSVAVFDGFNEKGKKEIVIGAYGDDDGATDAGAVYILDLGVSNFLTLSKNKVTFTASSGTDHISVNSNVSWTATSDQPWLTVNPTSGTGNDTLLFTASANTTGAARSATVTISSQGIENRTVTITQEAQILPFLNVSVATLSIASAAGSSTVSVTSNVSWSVSSDQSWLKVASSSGKNNGTLTLTAEANTADVSRTATITVSSPDVASKTIVVTQSRKEFIELAPDTVTIGSGYGSTASFNVTSNISWSAASDQLWLSVSPKSSTGNQKVTVSALSANQSVSLRSAVVIVSGTGVASKQVTVIQSAGDTILTVSPSTLTVGYAEGSSIWMVVTSNTMWSVTCDQPWLTSNPVSSSGSKNVIFTANANPDGTPRTATVTITALGALSRTVTVTQVGKPMLFFANDTIRIAKEEGSKGYLAISSNVSWKATTGQPWLDIDPGSGTGEDTIEFTALTSNPTTSSRATVVTLTGVGIGYKQVTVIQEAGDTVLVASGNWADIPKEGGSVSVITVTSNVFWNAGSDQSWLDVNPEAGSGNVLLRFMAEANPTVLPRTAMVTITSPGVEPLTIEVTQAAGDAYLKVSADKVVIGAEEGDTAIIEIQSNTTWNVASEEDWLTVDPQTGTGNDTLVFTAQANPSDIDRPVYVEITAGEDQTRTILVVQMAGTVGNELIEDKPISVYPNPVAEGFRVEGIEGQTEVVVTDLSGRVYLKTVVNGNEYIPAATLAKGVYLIRISGRTIFTEKKLVKL